MSPDTSTLAASLSAGSSCYNPVDYGADSTGVADSRPGIQAAIDAAAAAGRGQVCIPAGTFRVTRAPLGSYNRFAALSTHGQNIEIAGAGPGTVIKAEGDATASTYLVIGVDPGARNVKIGKLVIDTVGLYNTEEQTHAVGVGSSLGTGLIQDITLDGIEYVHPKVFGVRKGDCVRLLGNVLDTAVHRVKIINSTFTNCARSGIAIQRNVFSLKIIGNHFTQATDQDIDGEASGGQWDEGLEIADNTFDDDVTLSQGNYSVALTSYRRAIVTGNNFRGRGIYLYRTSDVTIASNTFLADFDTSNGVIEFSNLADRAIVANNNITRRGVAGSVIRVGPHSGGLPSRLLVSGNHLTNETAGSGIDFESAQNVSVVGNDLFWAVPAPGQGAIVLRSIAVSGAGILIQGNRILGPVTRAVVLHASPLPITDASVVGNYSVGVTYGLRCEQSVAGNFPNPIVHSANRWSGAMDCASAVLVTQYP